MIPNFVWALDEVQGDFIALCEGDDYWINSEKLKLQYNCFITNPSAKLVHTLTQDSFGNTLNQEKQSIRGTEAIATLANRNFILTASAMFKREILKQHNWLFASYPFGDWPLWLTCAVYGEIHFMNVITAVYRINDVGVWQNNWKDRIGSDRILKEIELLQEFTNAFPEYHEEVKPGVIWRLKKLYEFHIEMQSYGTIIRPPLSRFVKTFPELKSYRKKAIIGYLKAKTGL
jgi:hypothetical protein